MSVLAKASEAVFVTALAVILGHCNQGCLQHTEADAQTVQDAYKAEMTSCVAISPTPKEACECRKAVDTKWGVCQRFPTVGRCSTECR
jgi:hypothetical protein